MSPVAWLFVLYVGLFTPYAAWQSSRRIEQRPTQLPPRTKLYASSAVFQVTLLAFAWITAHQQRIQLFPVPHIRPADALVGVAWVGIKYVRLWSVLRRPEAMRRRRVLQHLAPRSPREMVGYAGLVSLAAVAEEAAYRGVLFQLGLQATGSIWFAALASAVVFGAGHLTQGRGPAVVTGVLGLGNQVVVLLTGSLWVAIAAHFAYDVLAGLAVAGAHRDGDAGSGPAALAQPQTPL